MARPWNAITKEERRSTTCWENKRSVTPILYIVNKQRINGPNLDINVFSSRSEKKPQKHRAEARGRTRLYPFSFHLFIAIRYCDYFPFFVSLDFYHNGQAFDKNREKKWALSADFVATETRRPPVFGLDGRESFSISVFGFWNFIY